MERPLEDLQISCMRELFEDMNERNARMRHSSPLLAIDETLYPYHGHNGFKQYNPNKPANYGFFHQSLCDSSIQLLIGRKELSCMFISQYRKSCLFLTVIKRKVVRRM